MYMEIKEKKWCVYIHTNKINGKKYVGQTCQDPRKRWGKDGIGYKRNPYFWNAIQKYGWDSFTHEIIASNLTIDEANELEEKLIHSLDSMNPDCGYNMQSGGENRLHLEKTKQKIREAHKGKIVSEETKGKISEAMSGENHPFYGTHRSDSTKRKIGDAQIGEKNHMFGKHHTEEEKEKVREKLLGGKNHNAVKIVQLTADFKFIKFWDSISEAEREIGKTGIGMCCKHERKTIGGFVWMYKEEYEKVVLQNEKDCCV